MNDTQTGLLPDELATQRLRRLFCRRGFQRVHLNKFEEYGLYIDNLNFLETESIITFMNFDGRLLALKPDATLSIVKNVSQKDLNCFEKLYYIDEVYRLNTENREYQVVNQVGVELIGETNGFAGAEVVDLAVESLRLLERPFVLTLSHLGFVEGLLQMTGLRRDLQEAVYRSLFSKSVHGAVALLRGQNVPEELVDRVVCAAELRGSLCEALPQAAELVCCDAMAGAVAELGSLARALGDACEFVHLDFSVVNSLDYYNGLIFQGYIQGVPHMVLSGGRYDKLMKKMGKTGGAIGFAISLDGLNTYLRGPVETDFDVLITYGPNADYGALLGHVRRLSAQGGRVRVEKAGCDLAGAGFTFARHMAFNDGTLEEVPVC